MTFKKLLYIPILATIMFFCHLFLFKIIEINTITFTYTLLQLYLFYSSMSLVVVTISILILKKNIDQVGMVFMATTVVKMMICAVAIQPVLAQTTSNIKIEKINFFVLFLIFLAIETLFTIRILNNKQ